MTVAHSESPLIYPLRHEELGVRVRPGLATRISRDGVAVALRQRWVHIGELRSPRLPKIEMVVLAERDFGVKTSDLPYQVGTRQHGRNPESA